MNVNEDPAELFTSTAPYYVRYRSGYPPAFFAYLIDRFALDSTQTVLDLGCGTGQIAIPLAPHTARVLAVDPEPTMLEQARRLAAEHGVTTIDWIQGDAHRLHEFDFPALDLVTMGASFHWTDREALMVELDTLVASGGAVVVASGGAAGKRIPSSLNDAIAALRTRYLGPTRRTGLGTNIPRDERHADVLRRSPFSHVDRVTWAWQLPRDVDSLVGLQFTYSYSAPVRFGHEATRLRFEHELRELLRAHFPDGVTETIHTEALIATRP